MGDKDENKKLRELLWLNHGCPLPGLYGDDGERQCHGCGVDFKRASAERIEKIWIQRRKKETVAQPSQVKEMWNMDTEITTEDLGAVLDSMVEAFAAERHKSKPYKEMFKAGSTFTGLLRRLECECIKNVLDAFDVYKNKLSGNVKSHAVFEFFLALPYISHKLEEFIQKIEGSACCVDKSFFLLSEELKRLTSLRG